MSTETWKKWRLLVGIACLAMAMLGSAYVASTSNEWVRAAGLAAMFLGGSVLVRKFIRADDDHSDLEGRPRKKEDEGAMSR